MKLLSDTFIIHILANLCNVHVSRFEKNPKKCVVIGHTYGRSSWREPPSWGRGGDKMKSITARLGVVVFVDDPVSWDFVWGEESGVGPGHIHPVGGQHVDPPVTRCPSHVEQKLRGLRNRRGMITIAPKSIVNKNHFNKNYHSKYRPLLFRVATSAASRRATRICNFQWSNSVLHSNRMVTFDGLWSKSFPHGTN